MPRVTTRDRIRHYIEQRIHDGEPPTVREIARAVGLRSPSSVQKHLERLAASGVLKRGKRGRSRAWRVPSDGDLAARPQPHTDGERPTNGARDPEPQPSIAVVGKLAEGTRIETSEPQSMNGTESAASLLRPPVTRPIDDALANEPKGVSREGEVIAVEIADRRYADAGLRTGDLLIVRRQPRMDVGDIALVEWNGSGALLRWRRRGATTELNDDNRHFDALPLSRGLDLVVIGRVTGFVRRFRS